MALDEFTKKRYYKALYGCMDNMTDECSNDKDQKACKVCQYGKVILEIQGNMTDKEYAQAMADFIWEVIN